MKFAKTKRYLLSVIIAFAIAFSMVAASPKNLVYAASGTVYTCTVNRCYAHPVTGVIEDSGGQASYATGQGMVEGCVYANGILEVTDSGDYYLTIRMSLMDYTSGHDFKVQTAGDSGWSTPSEIGVTGNGSDSNGTTADVCMKVPSQNCVVRGSMYVEPMGRDVVFYVYPSDFTEGNNTDMKATIVTAASNSGSSTQSESSSSTGATDNSSDSTSQSSSASSQSSSLKSASSLSSGSGLLSSTDSDDTTDDASDSDESAPKLESSISEAAAPSTDSSLDSAEGLSLSTAKDADSKSSSSDKDSASAASGSQIFEIALAVVVSGLILIAAVAGVVFFFRKNWRRWGGAEDDE